MTQLVPWILAHGLAALAIASAVGTLFGVLEKYLPGKWGNAAGTVAGALIDVVKIGAQIYALLGGQPPSSPMGKRLTRGVFDNTTGNGPPIVLGKKPSADSFVMMCTRMRRLAIAFAFGLLVTIGLGTCSSLQPAAGPTADAVACASGYIVQTGLEGVAPTVGGFEAQCAKEIVGLTTAALTTIFDLLVQAFALPPPDAGAVKYTPPSPYLSGAIALRNAYASKAGAR